MLFRQIVQEDLSCASYLIGCSGCGVAAVVDPQWDIEPYLRLSRLHGLHIEHVLETHNHADHVSGHGRLARATGATIHIHALAEAEYPHEAFEDGWVLDLGGDVRVEALHTPGHRPEHTAFLVSSHGRDAAPWAVLTGDSLFVGDVARPDLAVDAENGARDLHDSLARLLALPGEVEVWPGHLGGSACGGGAMDNKSSSTIAFERDRNRSLQISDRDEFVAATIASLSTRPPNVEYVVSLNRGPLLESLGTPAPLSPRAVEVAIAEGAVLVDARTNEQFDEAHIPGAISASAYDTGFATKVAHVIDRGVEVIVVAASDGYELEAAKLLASVGIRVRGFLEGGMTAWRSEERPVERLTMISVAQLADRMQDEEITVVDVRGERDFAAGHIPGSVSIPYADLMDRLHELPRRGPIATVCSVGKRSGLAASILQREGFGELLHVAPGGVGTWLKQRAAFAPSAR
jgi:glyoxylase-like metal-dependent hydrolase (beta-lactamase superfamily II)/rhodanese-related sulfurtransferase